jgi:hypothetical protein
MLILVVTGLGRCAVRMRLPGVWWSALIGALPGIPGGGLLVIRVR